jgi:hypothetical protein
MVTLLGSPPNFAMFFCTHLKAITWSFIPLLPGIPASGRLRNPRGRIHIFTKLAEGHRKYS